MDTDGKLDKQNSSQIYKSDTEYLYIPLGLVSTLLGKGVRTRKKSITGNIFTVTKDDLVNLHTRLDQRIYSQNMKGSSEEPEPIFEGKVYFVDNVIDSINSINDVAVYPEGGKGVEKIEIQWTYFTKFANRPSYEKQLILVTFIAGSGFSDNKSTVSEGISNDEIFSLFDMVFGPFLKGTIDIEIEYTNYQWAADIEKVILDNLSHIFKTKSTWRNFVNGKAFFLSLFSFLSHVVFVYLLHWSAVRQATQQFVEALESIPADALAEKNSFLTSVLASHALKANLLTNSDLVDITGPLSSLPFNRSWILDTSIFLIFIAHIAAFYLARSCIKPYDRSFILINKASYSEKERYEEKHKNGFSKLIGLLLFSIFASLVAAFLYEFVFSFNVFDIMTL